MRHSSLRASDVSDTLDSMKKGGALGGFFPVIEGSAIAGSAMPVLVTEKVLPNDMRAGLKEAIDAAPSGSVLVISSSSDKYSAWGGRVSQSAKSRIRGVVLSGCVRDLEEIRALGFPVFAKAKSPVSGYGRLEVVSIGEPVKIGGVTVRKGDLVVADADGVAFVPRKDAEEVKRRVAELVDAGAKVGRSARFGPRSTH